MVACIHRQINRLLLRHENVVNVWIVRILLLIDLYLVIVPYKLAVAFLLSAAADWFLYKEADYNLFLIYSGR